MSNKFVLYKKATLTNADGKFSETRSFEIDVSE